MPDVLVIGAGLAGFVAALAARAEGASVRVIAAGPGATALADGALDSILARPPFSAPLGKTPYDALGATDPACPPCQVGEGAALAFEALARVGLSYGGPSGGAPDLHLLATGGRSRRATYAAAAAARVEDLGPGTVLAGLEGDPGSDPAPAARALGRGVATAILPRPEPAPLATPSFVKIARALEDAAVRSVWVAEAKGRLGAGARLVILPPVLGIERPDDVRREVASALGVEIREHLDPNGVPGLRLERAIHEALAAAAVEVFRGEAPRPLPEARAYVLATGRFIGGGLYEDPSSPGEIRESLLDIPVRLDGRLLASVPRERRLKLALTAPHPLFHAGIAIDASARAVDASFERPIFAAGAIVGGFDPTLGGGFGVAAATGLLAGRGAARSARRGG